jgi:hypothetical protein
LLALLEKERKSVCCSLPELLGGAGGQVLLGVDDIAAIDEGACCIDHPPFGHELAHTREHLAHASARLLAHHLTGTELVQGYGVDVDTIPGCNAGRQGTSPSHEADGFTDAPGNRYDILHQAVWRVIGMIGTLPAATGFEQVTGAVLTEKGHDVSPTELAVARTGGQKQDRRALSAYTGDDLDAVPGCRAEVSFLVCLSFGSHDWAPTQRKVFEAPEFQSLYS